MVPFLKKPVSVGAKFRESFHGGGFVQTIERPDRHVKFPLRDLELPINFRGPITRRRRTALGTDRYLNRIGYNLLCDRRGNRLPLRTITGRRAPVNPVGGVVCGRYDHAGAAGTTPQHSESGKQPFGSRAGSTRHLDPLNRLPKVPVHDRFMRGKVRELPEVKFPKHHPGLKEAADPVVGPLNAVVSKERPDRLDGFAVAAHLEYFANNRREIIRHKHPVRSFRVTGYPYIPGRDPSGDRPGLTFGHAAFQLSALVFRDESKKPGLQPFPIGAPGHFAGVKREYAAPGFFDSVENFRLNFQGSKQPVEIGDRQHVRSTLFDAVKCGGESGPVREIRATGHVEFFPDAYQCCPLAFAPVGDPVGLLNRADEAFTFPAFDAGNPDQSDYFHSIPTCSPRDVLEVTACSPYCRDYGTGP